MFASITWLALSTGVKITEDDAALVGLPEGQPQKTVIVQVAQVDAAVGEAIDQAQQAVEGVEERWQAGQLRTDVAVDTDHFQVGQLRGTDVDVFGVGNGDAELVFLETRGNVRVGTGIDVRVHAQ